MSLQPASLLESCFLLLCITGGNRNSSSKYLAPSNPHGRPGLCFWLLVPAQPISDSVIRRWQPCLSASQPEECIILKAELFFFLFVCQYVLIMVPGFGEALKELIIQTGKSWKTCSKWIKSHFRIFCESSLPIHTILFKLIPTKICNMISCQVCANRAYLSLLNLMKLICILSCFI